MTNKKFYILLFIDFFLLKIYAGCLCRKKKPESNLYFKDGHYPTIKLRFKNKIDVSDIYYDTYLFIENDGRQCRDSFVFYYGKPTDESPIMFSTDTRFIDNYGKKHADIDSVYTIDEKYLNIELGDNINEDVKKNIKKKYFNNNEKYVGYKYYYFTENNESYMYKKFLPEDDQFIEDAMKDTTFTIDKYKEKKPINEIKVSGKYVSGTSSDYRIRTEFYIKSKKQTITVDFYRSKVQCPDDYYTFGCEIKFNGKRIDGIENIINNNNDSDKVNIFTIDN